MANMREIVLSILMEYDRDDNRKVSLLKDSLEKYDYLETRDKSFIKRVVDGTLERKIQIDYILNRFSKTGTAKMQPFIRSLMRMSVYQIMFMDSVPDSAACNEAVKLAAKHKFVNLKGFVNGVLRNVARNKDNVEYPVKDINGGVDHLSVCYSMPEWICKMWLDRYGFDKTESILKFFLETRPTTVRLNMKALSDADEIDALVKELESAGAVVKKNHILPYALELEKTDNIRFLPGFMEGKYTVQDISSMLLTEIADPKPGQTVIDACAAPGGKSLHAAERVLSENSSKDSSANGHVISRDLSERKCDLIRDNADRMGLTNIDISAHDARITDENLTEKADILYLDVPCSGLGIMGRKNDIKYNVTPESAGELTDLQWEIVKACEGYVKKGGILMYSTCTVNAAENEEMVQRICKELPFKPVDISKDLQRLGLDKDNAGTEGYIQLIPGEYGTDGFFIAKLQKQ